MTMNAEWTPTVTTKGGQATVILHTVTIATMMTIVSPIFARSYAMHSQDVEVLRISITTLTGTSLLVNS